MRKQLWTRLTAAALAALLTAALPTGISAAAQEDTAPPVEETPLTEILPAEPLTSRTHLRQRNPLRYRRRSLSRRSCLRSLWRKPRQKMPQAQRCPIWMKMERLRVSPAPLW